MTKQEQADYVNTTREKGADTGCYVATKGWVQADALIYSAAIGYVNSLPLNNIAFEKELVWNYCAAAEIAATQKSRLYGRQMFEAGTITISDRPWGDISPSGATEAIEP